MNSLRSNSISCRFACLAFAIQESKKIPIIVHPLKTSSCGMFSRIKFEKTWSTKCGNRRQAFSVVGVKNMACPAIPKRRRKSSVSSWFRPPSSGRFRTFLCFVSFSDERNEKSRAGWNPAKRDLSTSVEMTG